MLLFYHAVTTVIDGPQHNHQPVDTSLDRVRVSDTFVALSFFTISLTLSITQHDSEEYCYTASSVVLKEVSLARPEDCVDVKAKTNGEYMYLE